MCGNKQLVGNSQNSDVIENHDETRGAGELAEISAAERHEDDSMQLFGGPFGSALKTYDGPSMPGKRKPGRPKGSVNKADKQMRAYVLANYRHPLLGFMDVFAMTPQEVAAQFEVGPEMAAKIWLRAGELGLNKLMSAPPQEVVVQGRTYHRIDMHFGDEARATDDETIIDIQPENIMKSIGYIESAASVAQESVARHD